MITRFKTSVNSEKEASVLVETLAPFYFQGVITFDLNQPDKTLTISCWEDDNHPDIVVDILKMAGHECSLIDIDFQE